MPPMQEPMQTPARGCSASLEFKLRILHGLFGGDQRELAEAFDAAELDLAEVCWRDRSPLPARRCGW